MSSRLIILQFTKTRVHSYIYIKMSLQEFVPTISYYILSPTTLDTTINGLSKEAKHFMFPGLIKHLKLPHWERFVTISYNHKLNKHLYTLFFHKTAYLD